jgi:hypothetical protein
LLEKAANGLPVLNELVNFTPHRLFGGGFVWGEKVTSEENDDCGMIKYSQLNSRI